MRQKISLKTITLSSVVYKLLSCNWLKHITATCIEKKSWIWTQFSTTFLLLITPNIWLQIGKNNLHNCNAYSTSCYSGTAKKYISHSRVMYTTILFIPYHWEKKTLIGQQNLCSMRWKAPDQEVDQRGHGKRMCKKIVKHVNWRGRML